MDIIVQREALLKPLQAVSGVVEKKQTLPILSNVLLATKDNKLSVIGTDIEIELIGFVDIELLAPGVTTVSAKKLFDICRTLPEEANLRLTVEKNNLIVRAGDSVFILNTLPAEDFPQIDEIEYVVSLSLSEGAFKNLLNKTHFAMGHQDVRPYLNGSFLDIGKTSMKCVAADGHRLALASMLIRNNTNLESKIILPRKSVLELIRLLSNDDASEITIGITEGKFRVVTSHFVFTSKLINANYPDYNRLIPKGNNSAIGERDLIKQALTRASILSNEKFRGVRFQLESSKLRITANNSDQEQAEEAVPLDYAGNSMEIAFNVAYLIDVVATITAKSIRWIFTDSNSGVLIEPHETEDDSLYVIMPMRL